MPAPLILRIIGDATSYFRTVEQTIGINAKLGGSYTTLGVRANTSADAQIRAAVKAQEALKVNALALSQRAATLPRGSKEQAAATLLAADAQKKYASSLGLTTTQQRRLGIASGTAERDVSRGVRGALAGSGAFSKFGKSLAFASLQFIGVAAAADLVIRSISQAQALATAQASLAVAITHTHGSLAALMPQYRATAKAAAEYGISEVDATTGLARATLLTGDAVKAQRAYREALLISKAIGKDFNSVLLATAKAQDGSTSALRRYIPLITSASSGSAQYTSVMARYGAQAAANTSASDKLRAVLANFEATIGQALLPTVDDLLRRLTAWLGKLQESGKLQKDVNDIVGVASDVFHVLGGVTHFVDKVTGSFANTLKLLLALKVASVLLRWGESLGIVAAAETGATATTVALTGAQTDLAVSSLAASATAGGLLTKLGALKALGEIGITIAVVYEVASHAKQLSDAIFGPGRSFAGRGLDSIFHFASGGVPVAANIGQLPPVLGGPGQQGSPGRPGGFLSGVKPIPQITTFALTASEQLAQAQAALTRSTTDDVAGAKHVIARIKRLIDQGKLHGAALVQALGAEASALGTIWSAEDAAAQKRAAAAQAAKARIAAQIQDSIDPLRLEVALSKAQASGEPLTAILRQMRAAAEAALASGKLNLTQQKEAYDQIASINGQLASQASAFALPLRLQLALAKAQALGTDQHAILERMKAALERALKKAKGNVQAQIDLWNQIAGINQQLGSSAASALGDFKQLNVDKIAKGLHLTAEQAKKLKAELSQIGPGGTVPGKGVGAYGYAVSAGGTVEHHHHHHHLYIDGKPVEASVRYHRQKRVSRNSSQRRGPNAGMGY